MGASGLSSLGRAFLPIMTLNLTGWSMRVCFDNPAAGMLALRSISTPLTSLYGGIGASG